MREQKRKRRFWVFLVLSLFWMGLIFYFSAQSAEESAELSTGTVDWLLAYDSKRHVLQNLAGKGILEFVVRKLAHAAEYGILAVFLGLTIYSSKRWKRKWQLKTVIFCCLYACSDEFHQLFVAGRSGQIRDVGIDTFGAVCAVLILWFSFIMIQHYELRR